MTVDELNRIAFSGADMPVGLISPEQGLFLKLRAMYESYKNAVKGKAEEEQKRIAEKYQREKAEIVKAYKSDLFMYNCQIQTTAMRNKLEHQLTDITKSGCPMCKKAVAIFDGTYRGLEREE